MVQGNRKRETPDMAGLDALTCDGYLSFKNSTYTRGVIKGNPDEGRLMDHVFCYYF